MEAWLEAIPGAKQLFDWFGYWPSFHDGVVLGIELSQIGPSKIKVHAFRMTDAVDAKGFYVCDKHCIVTFVFAEIVDVELSHFNDGNILFDIELTREENAFVIAFSATYGLEGTIKAKMLSLEMTPGIPTDSKYENTDV